MRQGGKMGKQSPVQAGPSSCGTTSIAHFFSDAHGLRVAKNYVEGAKPASALSDGACTSPMKIPLQIGRTYLLYKCFFHDLFVPSPIGWVPYFL